MAALDVMRRYLEAVQRGDWETGFGFFADDIVLHVPGRSSLAGEHRGRAAAEGYLQAALARSHGAEVAVELVDMLASEERVALIVRETFSGPGSAVEIRRANVYRLRGDQIAEVWIFEANQYEVDELFADG
ncbi:MAG TPA: nuclear transport factor 2 family protein [Actinomycetes bacterium]|nr:nuclear transport factor 2 family protein [Actinomycetes bacterium]